MHNMQPNVEQQVEPEPELEPEDQPQERLSSPNPGQQPAQPDEESRVIILPQYRRAANTAAHCVFSGLTLTVGRL